MSRYGTGTQNPDPKPPKYHRSKWEITHGAFTAVMFTAWALFILWVLVCYSPKYRPTMLGNAIGIFLPSTVQVRRYANGQITTLWDRTTGRKVTMVNYRHLSMREASEVLDALGVPQRERHFIGGTFSPWPRVDGTLPAWGPPVNIKLNQ